MTNPAEEASIACLQEVMAVLKESKNFLLEAGAGAGKTYTLIESLKFLIADREATLISTNARIACITYTNVAKDEIRSRTDNHPAVLAETIHAFSWGIIQDFQKTIRGKIPTLSDKWKERCDEAGDITQHRVIYNLGFPKISDREIFLHHDDVIRLMTLLLSDKKFLIILKTRFPVILIDEYQDTDKHLAKALVENLVEADSGPLIGFFGDHWQKIFGSGSVGLITAAAEKMTVIGKKANFRSDRLIVEALNRLRPELPQHEKDRESGGQITVLDSENFIGQRRTEAHWKNDLPVQDAHTFLNEVIKKLSEMDWSFEPNRTKILMLTNNVLAAEQGYQNLLSVFPESDDLLKKNNPYISFLIDVIEPGCVAYTEKKYGKMFRTFNLSAPKIRKFEDKKTWAENLDRLMQARETGTIGDVLEVLKETNRPRLPEKLVESGTRYLELKAKREDELDSKETKEIELYEALIKVPFNELRSVERYVQEETLFSTQHGVKGAQFENVLIVLGCGWNHYNWNQMLEYMQTGIPAGKEDSFERWRNLFYVACSRPKKRLCLLFTQKLSAGAKEKLSEIFQVTVESIIVPT
jgi:DNA helicase-2/ATP-dependent DNA helicase PcrA